MTEAPETVAAWLRETYAVGNALPVDLFRLAQRMGATVSVATMVEDGRLEHDTHATRIYLKRGTSHQRRRFTLAHELGHLWLASPETPVIAKRDALAKTNEERFCDRLAAALLLPVEAVETYADSPQYLRYVRELANSSVVSLTATLMRLVEVAGWSKSLLTWRFTNGKWRLSSTAALPRGLHGRVVSAPGTSQFLASRIGDSGSDIDIPLVIGEREMRLRAEVEVPYRGSALALLDLPGGASYRTPKQLSRREGGQNGRG